jgi:hypothetical protein
LLTISFVTVSFAADINKKVIDSGNYYSKILMKNLKKELKKAIKKGGALNAVTVCSEKALKITEAIFKKCKGIKIKRTTFKYRNPKNKPDKLETKALNYFKKHKKERYYIQKVTVNGQIFYNYYKKLTVVGICLKCHGVTGKMNPDLLKKLKKLYPEDKAVNYKAGDFRGVIKVSIPEKCLK